MVITCDPQEIARIRLAEECDPRSRQLHRFASQLKDNESRSRLINVFTFFTSCLKADTKLAAIKTTLQKLIKFSTKKKQP